MRRYAFESFITHTLWLAAVFILTDGLSQSPMTWLAQFNQWDARWYLTIALDGHGFLPQTYAFPPLHGWILGRITDLIFNILSFLRAPLPWLQTFYVVSFCVGLSTFAVANTILVWLAEHRWKINRRRLWLIAITNPVGYFAFTAYSDALFFLIFIAALSLATWTSGARERWQLPSLTAEQSFYAHSGLYALLFVAPWVRITGYAFAIWVLLKRKETIGVLLSLGAFLLYDRLKTGDAFFFLFAQKAFAMPAGTGLKGFVNSLEILMSFVNGIAYQGGDFFIYSFDFGLLPMIAFSLSMALIVWLFRQREHLWATAALAVVMISHNQAFWRSTVRYTLPLYPLFFWMLLANGHTKKYVRSIEIMTTFIAAISFVIQILYCRLFRSGAWAF